MTRLPARSTSGKFYFRQPARNLYVRRRHEALTSHQQVEARELREAIMILSSAKKYHKIKPGVQQKIEMVLTTLVKRYLGIVLAKEGEGWSILNVSKTRHRTIDSFDPSHCRMNFRFLKGDLHRLLLLLKIPEEIKFDNRSKQSGEEVMLRALFELTHGVQQEPHCSQLFGGVGSDQSRAFTWFIDYIFKTFKHLVQDNLHWWYENDFFRRSADAIGRKMGSTSQNLVAFFIDCNCMPTSVVGGGPAEEGANAARWDDCLQRAFYNGWKSVHGLKHQTVDNAYGMTVDMAGPTSLRRNDLWVLRISEIQERISELQEGDIDQFVIFGDSAYPRTSHLRSYFKAAEGVADFLRWNSAMKKVRISIEWNYGYTASLFRILSNKDKLKVMQEGGRVREVYTVCTLLRNFSVGLYGGQTSNYFNLTLPENFLEAYINQTPVY
jgi:hypothetical protein